MENQEIEWLLKEKYGGEKTEGFFTDVKRLEAGEPLGYVIGHVPFLGCTIYLDSRPLIPRPETEFWTEKAIERIKQSSHLNERIVDRDVRIVRILDLCAGSGAIGVAVAHHVPGAIVHFAEIDAAHLPTIAKNLAENQIACTKYRVWQSDLFENLPPTQYNSTKNPAILDEMRGRGEFLTETYRAYGEEKIGAPNDADRQNGGVFDFILSNPPYIDPTLDRAEASVKNFEPHLALYGGKDGMELIERIVVGARAKLAPRTGELWLEHEPEQVAAIKALAEKHGFLATTHPDQYQVLRYSVLVLQ